MVCPGTAGASVVCGGAAVADGAKVPGCAGVAGGTEVGGCAAVAAGAGVVDGARAGGAPGPLCARASLAVYQEPAIAQANPAMKMETRIFTKDLHPMTVDI